MSKSNYYPFSLCIFLVLLFPVIANGQSQDQIDNFIVRENLLKNGKLAIIAADSLETPIEQVNGTFQFSINGFSHPLTFRDGVAITPNKVEKSTFVFIKHLNENGSHGKLFYVLKKDSGLNPVKISWIFLIIIPVALMLIVMMFKRFMVIAIIGLLIFFYFNYKQGLDLTTFFETLVHGIKGLFA